MNREADPGRDAEMDALVQRALAPTPESESRVVAAALAAETLPTRPLWTALASRPAVAGAAALLLVALLAGGLLWRAAPSAPEPAPKGTVTNEGSVTVIRMPGEPLTLIGPGSEPPNVPPGTVSIVLLGEPR